jgi:hypothetical protein
MIRTSVRIGRIPGLEKPESGVAMPGGATAPKCWSRDGAKGGAMCRNHVCGREVISPLHPL